jgi:hypothetical protein
MALFCLMTGSFLTFCQGWLVALAFEPTLYGLRARKSILNIKK